MRFLKFSTVVFLIVFYVVLFSANVHVVTNTALYPQPDFSVGINIDRIRAFLTVKGVFVNFNMGTTVESESTGKEQSMELNASGNFMAAGLGGGYDILRNESNELWLYASYETFILKKVDASYSGPNEEEYSSNIDNFVEDINEQLKNTNISRAQIGAYVDHKFDKWFGLFTRIGLNIYMIDYSNKIDQSSITAKIVSNLRLSTLSFIDAGLSFEF